MCNGNCEGMNYLTTWLSRPMVNNIRKNNTAHIGEIGRLATASGYATNVNPGPEVERSHNELKRSIPIRYTCKYRQYDPCTFVCSLVIDFCLFFKYIKWIYMHVELSVTKCRTRGLSIVFKSLHGNFHNVILWHSNHRFQIMGIMSLINYSASIPYNEFS